MSTSTQTDLIDGFIGEFGRPPFATLKRGAIGSTALWVGVYAAGVPSRRVECARHPHG
jgi:hypothetical protein